jgi:RNA polymerase sigma-70 factor (ECF subfamily)
MNCQQPTDEDLAGEAQVGSLAAFEELVKRYERRIYAFVSQTCRNKTSVAEITQDTFVKAFQSLARYDRNYNFSTWLFTIARRKCIDHFRKNSHVPEESVAEPVDMEDPSAQLAEEEDSKLLWARTQALLPPIQFQALWLRYCEDMGVAEIAAVLRKSQTHVKVILFRARQTLARELPRDNSGPVRNSRPEISLAARAPHLAPSQILKLT